jgi:hypothetical protein
MEALRIASKRNAIPYKQRDLLSNKADYNRIIKNSYLRPLQLLQRSEVQGAIYEEVRK